MEWLVSRLEPALPHESNQHHTRKTYRALRNIGLRGGFGFGLKKRDNSSAGSARDAIWGFGRLELQPHLPIDGE